MSFIKTLLDFLFPQACLICKKRNNSVFCLDCQSKIKKNNLCQICGKFVLLEIFCSKCKKNFFCAKAYSLGIYEGVLKKAVCLLKYKKKINLADSLKELISNYLKENKINFNAETIIPVPLFYKKMKQRGFNQASIVAKALGKFLNLEVREDILHKIKDTPPQNKLKRKERLNNVKLSFKVNILNNLPGKVILVDDVITTGATLRECARTLKEKGVDRIYFYTLARSVYSRN
ncbi:MAG: ComF family protein [Armatimonadetes bacterium]|nr:ComF family protein [Armatimonadota bacterium]